MLPKHPTTLVTDDPEEVARLLNKGGIVAFPTETVYGLGAGIDFPEAVQRVFTAKGRPGDNPLIVHIGTPQQLEQVTEGVGADARKLIEAFFPGPLTLVLRKSRRVPDCVSAGLGTVGVRCPEHPTARQFLRHSACPVAAPSANRSGRPSATSWEAVQEDLDGRIDAILRGEQSRIGLESTIVDCTGRHPVLLRSGAIPLESLQQVVPDTASAQRRNLGESPKSPGLKYPHYAPKATVRLIEAGDRPDLPPNAAWIGMEAAPEGARLARVCDSPEAYANALFSFFRTCDHQGIGTVYCLLPGKEGIGQAIRDRLERAAEGR